MKPDTVNTVKLGYSKMIKLNTVGYGLTEQIIKLCAVNIVTE